MRRYMLPASLALVACPSLALAAGATFTATLSGANEVDAQGVGNQGDADGKGSFSGRLAPARNELCYSLNWSAIDTPTMAHIHSAAAGANGPVFIPFTELTPGEHCIAIDAAKAAALSAKPGDFYVNVHNTAYPRGAVRGQISTE